MKTSKIVAALVAMSASAAMAGAQFEFRTDYTSLTPNDDARSALLHKEYSTTQVTRARIALGMKATEELSLDARLDALASTPTNGSPRQGSATDYVEYGYATYKVMPGLAITMGKLAAVGGGFEYQYNPADVPWMSNLNGYVAPKNSGGIGATYTIGDQAFDLQMLNEGTTDTQNNANGATRSTPNFRYLGSFMGKKLQFTAYYNQIKPTDKSITTSGLGVKYDFGVASVDFDYGMVTDQVNGTAAGDDTVNGMVLKVDVPVASWIIQPKVESTEHKDNGTKDHTYTNYGVTAIKPLTSNASSAFLVGVALKNDKVEAQNKTGTDTVLFAGFKIFADLIK